MTLRNMSIVFSATLGIPSSIFNLLLVEFDYIFWTDKCQDQTVPASVHPLFNSLVKEEISRSKRNSIHYQDNTPKDFISLEKRLNGKLLQIIIIFQIAKLLFSIYIAVIDDISPYEDESCYSDDELEVAYFASRYTANSSHPLDNTRY